MGQLVGSGEGTELLAVWAAVVIAAEGMAMAAVVAAVVVEGAVPVVRGQSG